MDDADFCPDGLVDEGDVRSGDVVAVFRLQALAGLLLESLDCLACGNCTFAGADQFGCVFLRQRIKQGDELNVEPSAEA